MANSIGAVRVDLVADPSGIKDGIAQASSALAGLGISSVAIGNIISKAFTDALAAVKDAVKDALERVEAFSNIADKLKIKPGDFSTALAGTFDDVKDFNDLLDGLKGKIAEAVEKPMSQAAISFQTLGVQTKDATGKTRDLYNVFVDTAAAIAASKDGFSKTALAVDVFGENAKDAMDKIKELGAKGGIQDAIDESKEFGTYLSTEGLRAAKVYSDANDSLTKSWKGISDTITDAFLPVVAEIQKAYAANVEWIAKNIQSLRDYGHAWGEVFQALDLANTSMKAIMTTGIAIGAVFSTLATLIAAPIAALIQLSQGDFSGALETLSKGWRDLSGEVSDTSKKITDLWTAAKGAMDDASKTDTAVAGIQRVRVSVDDLKKSMADAKKAAKDVLQEVLQSPWSTLSDKITALNVAFDNGALRLTEYQKKLVEVKDQALKPVYDAFETFFVSVLDGSTKISDALKTLTKALEDLALKAIFKELFGGLFSSAAGGGGGLLSSLFSGLSGMPKAASGLNFMVGGAGAVDSQVVAFRASPGERVAVGDDVGPVSSGSGGQPNVIVNNYTDAQVSTRQNPNGDLELTVRQIVNDQLSRQGGRDAMSSTYGLRPKIRSR
jgi:hypothetical protein